MRDPCCAHPILHRAWVPFKPFGRAVYCDHCGEITIDMRPIGNFLWEQFVAPFWNGCIEVDNRELNTGKAES